MARINGPEQLAVQVPRRLCRRRWVAVLVAGLLLASACSGDASDASSTSTYLDPTTTGTLEKTQGGAIESELLPIDPGSAVASIDGVGVLVAEGPALASADVTVSAVDYQSDLPDGLLAVGRGLHVEIDGELATSAQVRLRLPERPSADAVPIVLYVGDDGTETLRFPLWLEDSGEVVLWTTSFSSFFSGWLDPVGDVADSILNPLDGVFDYFTGRTDPPECRDDVDWGSYTSEELSSVHVCLQSNDDGGDPRAEILLRSNRNTYQIVNEPKNAEFTWIEDELWFNDLVSPYLGATGSHVLLPGGKQVSFGFRQRSDEMDFQIRALQSPQIIVLNGVLAFVGGAESKDAVLALLILSFNCLWDLGLSDGGIIDTTAELLETAVSCVVNALASDDSEKLLEAAIDLIGIGDAARISSKAEGGLKLLRPTAKGLARFLGVGGAGVFAWDSIFDNIAEGRLDVHFDASDQVAAVDADALADSCSGDVLLRDLGSQVSIIGEACVGGWAVVDLCNEEPCGDSWALVRFHDGNWVRVTGFPTSSCRSDFAAMGAPDTVLDAVSWGPGCGQLTATTTTATTTTTTTATSSKAAVYDAFVAAWNAQNWSAMTVVADTATVALAQGSAVPGGAVVLGPCISLNPGYDTCEIAYGIEGSTNLFVFRLSDRVTQLERSA